MTYFQRFWEFWKIAGLWGSVVIAVQWMKAHKTGTSTAYSPASTQPTPCSSTWVFKSNASYFACFVFWQKHLKITKPLTQKQQQKERKRRLAIVTLISSEYNLQKGQNGNIGNISTGIKIMGNHCKLYFPILETSGSFRDSHNADLEKAPGL